MKKILSILLATAMSFSMVACSSSREKQPSEDDGYKMNPELIVDDPGDRTKLTLACFIIMPEIEQRIIDFNNTNEEYYIEVKDYSQYNTEDDYSAGETKLNTEIQSGNMPDLIELSNLPMQSYINKGLLSNLDDYLENDEDLSKDSLVEGAYNALKSSNGLYQISPSFTVTSLCGTKTKIGERKSWNAKELQQFLKDNSDVKAPFINMPPLQILHSLTMYSLDSFVDREKGKSNFDSEEFKAILETVKEFSKTGDNEYKEADQELLGNKGLLATKYIARIEQYADAFRGLNGDVNFIGFPTEEGKGNFADFQFTFGMFENSQNKDGAWEFLKSFLDEDYQKQASEYETPVLKSAYDNAITNSEATDEEKAMYDEFINSLDKSSDFDETLMKIIEEETNEFLAGNTSVEDTAKAIQSRASIYLAEGK